jgi:hypothetical protein
MGRGNIAKEAGRVGADDRFTATVGSFELQLDTPNAASSPSAITVHTTRSGVQNLILLTSCFIPGIATSFLFAEPE